MRRRNTTQKTVSTLLKTQCPENGLYSKLDKEERQHRWIDAMLLSKSFIVLCQFVVLVLCVGISCLFSWILYSVHENNLWFSHISTVEKEISFRTESGLYYSYMKHIISSKDNSAALHGLLYDNVTEYGRTINILERFNVFQEVVLGFIYRECAWLKQIHPMVFYVNVLFSLQSLIALSLTALTYVVSSSVIGALLCGVLITTHISDITRADQSPALRENWATPFYYTFLLATTCLFKQHSSKFCHIISTSIAFISCTLFCLFWQFNQFILLLTSLASFGLAVLDLVPSGKTCVILWAQWSSLFLCALMQFGNKFILGSLELSFVPTASIILMLLCKLNRKQFTIYIELVVSILAVCIALVFSVFVSFVLKRFLNASDDSHIVKFLWYKFFDGSEKLLRTDFDSNLYLCEQIFSPMPMSSLSTLALKGILIPYAFASSFLATVLVNLIRSTVRREGQRRFERPELAFLFAVNLVFCVLGLTTMRFKFFWISTSCVLTSAFLTDNSLYESIPPLNGRKVKILRFFVVTMLCSYVIGYNYQPIAKRVNTLTEFYDPDTVELIHFLNQNTPKNAVFTATMQVCAMIKLGTARAVTNHPHYENQWLRGRTSKAYQIYSRLPPQKIHAILQEMGTTYIVLEASICFQRGKEPQCKTKGVIDLHNGHLPEDLPEDIQLKNKHLKKVTIERFCKELFLLPDKFSQWFSIAFQNKTFRVYKVKY